MAGATWRRLAIRLRDGASLRQSLCLIAQHLRVAHVLREYYVVLIQLDSAGCRCSICRLAVHFQAHLLWFSILLVLVTDHAHLSDLLALNILGSATQSLAHSVAVGAALFVVDQGLRENAASMRGACSARQLVH